MDRGHHPDRRGIKHILDYGITRIEQSGLVTFCTAVGVSAVVLMIMNVVGLPEATIPSVRILWNVLAVAISFVCPFVFRRMLQLLRRRPPSGPSPGVKRD